MPTEHQASRTLVKSPPELWAECSDAGSLARHIGEFGEIRITRLEPETCVAWEGEHASGTIEIEPSGWGTRVTLTAQTEAEGEAVVEETDAASEETDAAPEEVAIVENAGPPLEEPAPPTADPPNHEAESRRDEEEEADATLEETLAEPDPVLEAEPDPARGWWKRVRARTRSWFKPEEPSTPNAVQEDVEESIPPPERSAITPEQAAPEPVAGTPELTADPPELPADPEPSSEPPPAPDIPEPQLDAEAVLMAALDSLGQAHHRPFSRA